MCVGVWEDSLIARVGPDAYQAALDQPHAREFDFSGRAMKGWVLVEPTAWKQIANWTTRSVAFVITLPQK
jgi:hypothetical protein